MGMRGMIPVPDVKPAGDTGAGRALLRMLNRRRRPAGAAAGEHLIAFLRTVPHPYALDDVKLSCVCGLGPGDEVHDEASLLDTRAFLNGTGGPREEFARGLAAETAAAGKPARGPREGGQNVTGQVKAEGGESPALPPGVLGYAVGVFPVGGDECTGLTHTGLMSAASARKEAGQYAAAARGGAKGAFQGTCGYRAVEVREIGGGGS